MKRVKEASGLSVFLLEEIGDARLRCNQLKDYLGEATGLIEKSSHRDHFFEVAGHLLHGIPDTVMRIENALNAAAMAVSKWEYEELKEDLRPEKAEQLEDALKDVRVRRVRRKSSEPEASVKIQETAGQLRQIAASIEGEGRVDAAAIARLISALEGDSVRTAASDRQVAATLRRFAGDLESKERRPSRSMLAAMLRRVLAETADVKAVFGADPVRTADVLEPEMDSQYNMTLGFEFIRNASRMAYLRGVTGNQMRQAFEQLAAIVSEIGLMCDSVGASDVAGLAIRMSKAVRLARRFLKPDVLDSMVMASDESEQESDVEAHIKAKDLVPKPRPKKYSTDEKESRFEEGKPADPTEHMDEDDAAKWKTEHEKHKDNFKSARGRFLDEIERKYAADDKESRYEEGAPADPTQNMSEQDAEQWKSNTDKYEDKFKAASRKRADDERESRYEEGKPADPTENMSEDDAEDWKSNTDKYEDKFKAAASSAVREMEELLKDHGYNPKDAKKLDDEGMGPHELEKRLKEKGGLERTHRLEKLAQAHARQASAAVDPWKV